MQLICRRRMTKQKNKQLITCSILHPLIFKQTKGEADATDQLPKYATESDVFSEDRSLTHSLPAASLLMQTRHIKCRATKFRISGQVAWI